MGYRFICQMVYIAHKSSVRQCFKGYTPQVTIALKDSIINRGSNIMGQVLNFQGAAGDLLLRSFCYKSETSHIENACGTLKIQYFLT